METRNPYFELSRRHFLSKFISNGTLICFGCSNLMASTKLKKKSLNQSEKHKFLEKSNMSYQEFYDFTYGMIFIPIMQNLEKEIGKDKFIPIVKSASSKNAENLTKNMAKDLPNRDFPAFWDVVVAPYFDKNNRLFQHILTNELVEHTNSVIEFKITECLTAKTFRDANASDIGYACFCHGDFAATNAFNSKIKLIRTKTLMQGDDCCNHRYVFES